jgi:drug/metabolite transporter (DMT)-like permease
MPLGARVAIGLVTLYVLWGSTFLGIRIAIETVPPLLAAGLRWSLAGGLLYAAVRPRGGSDWTAWARSAAYALLLVVASNGGVTWAETRVPSGLAAVAIATVSPWLVVLDAVRPGGRRPGAVTVAGVLVGVVGVALLVDPRGAADPVAFAVLLGAAFAFALGTTIARLRPDDGPPLVSTARQMLAGGGVLLVLAAANGERVPSEVSVASAAAITALALLGSIVGLSLYGWLVRNTAPAVVGTYACANPIVALALGAGLAGEPLGARTVAAAALVVAGVALVTAGQASPLPVLVDWWRRMVYVRPTGGADAPHHRPRGLVERTRAAAAKAR